MTATLEKLTWFRKAQLVPWTWHQGRRGGRAPPEALTQHCRPTPRGAGPAGLPTARKERHPAQGRTPFLTVTLPSTPLGRAALSLNSSRGPTPFLLHYPNPWSQKALTSTAHTHTHTHTHAQLIDTHNSHTCTHWDTQLHTQARTHTTPTYTCVRTPTHDTYNSDIHARIDNTQLTHTHPSNTHTCRDVYTHAETHTTHTHPHAHPHKDNQST